MKCLIGPNFEPNFRLGLYNSITFNFLDFFSLFFQLWLCRSTICSWHKLAVQQLGCWHFPYLGQDGLLGALP